LEHAFLDRYSSIDSPVHRLDPRAKVLLALVFVITVVSTPPTHLLAFVVYAGLVSWTIALARVPLAWVLFRAAAVLPLSVLAALWLPFLRHGDTLSLFAGRLHLSIPGLWLFAGVAMKSFLGAAAAVLLVSTTPMSSLLQGLARLGAPVILVDLLALTYRYLFVLAGEAMRLRRAAFARGCRPRWLGQSLLIGRLIGQLFLRSYARAERLYAAMVLRGYDGRMPASRPLAFRAVDLAALVILSVNLLLVRILLR